MNATGLNSKNQSNTFCKNCDVVLISISIISAVVFVLLNSLSCANVLTNNTALLATNVGVLAFNLAFVIALLLSEFDSDRKVEAVCKPILAFLPLLFVNCVGLACGGNLPLTIAGVKGFLNVGGVNLPLLPISFGLYCWLTIPFNCRRICCDGKKDFEVAFQC